jgi:hypothetical protein
MFNEAVTTAPRAPRARRSLPTMFHGKHGRSNSSARERVCAAVGPHGVNKEAYRVSFISAITPRAAAVLAPTSRRSLRAYRSRLCPPCLGIIDLTHQAE